MKCTFRLKLHCKLNCRAQENRKKKFHSRNTSIIVTTKYSFWRQKTQSWLMALRSTSNIGGGRRGGTLHGTSPVIKANGVRRITCFTEKGRNQSMHKILNLNVIWLRWCSAFLWHACLDRSLCKKTLYGTCFCSLAIQWFLLEDSLTINLSHHVAVI